MSDTTPHPIRLEDYRPPAFLIDRISLDFELREQHSRVRSRLEIRRNPAAEGGQNNLELQGEELEMISLSLDGVELSQDCYALDDQGLTLTQVPKQFILESEVLIRPQMNTALEGLYKSGGIFCTQCEAEGFRKITWFLDRPDVMSTFTTSITADKSRYPVLLSNGNRVKNETLPDGRHRVVWEDPFPKPCYLFALVAGDLRRIEDQYVTKSGRAVALHIYVEQENIDKCDHAMRSLIKAMQWDEAHYGREYDLDIYMIVAVNDFNMGAMENKGLNVFNSKYVLARPDTATDEDFQGIEGVIAHEYFHNWTGNRITCRDWFQLSLKEGLTVFRDQSFSADMGSPEIKRIEDVSRLRAHQFVEDAGPMAHPVRPDSYIEINNFYTLTVYEKGAELVRMQQNLLGTEGFRAGMDLYFERHDGQAVTTDDFVQCMEDASGKDLQQFRLWYSQAGTPELRVEGAYDENDHSYTLTIEQHTPATPGQKDKASLHIPLAMGLLDESGRDLPLQLEGEAEPVKSGRVLELHKQQAHFRFIDLPCRPVPSLLRGFSAPVKLSYGYRDEELMFLMAHDSDGFNRWDAAQRLAQQLLLQQVQRPETPTPKGFIGAFGKALNDQTVDNALLAEILKLPSEVYLGEQMEQIDVEAIHRARESLLTTLVTELREDFMTRYQALSEQGEYRIEAEDIARRKLKNLCLGYLMQQCESEILQLCINQYRADHNMTDKLAALRLIADTSTPERDELLEDFYQRWRDDPLVVDKWFSVQAISKQPDTLPRVNMLAEHRAFSLTNPNRVRSLISVFSTNQVRFHDASGEGYRFLTDKVVELDAINPQIAARLARVLVSWRRYDAQRQHMMKAQLERILAVEKISRDLYEIASKSLA